MVSSTQRPTSSPVEYPASSVQGAVGSGQRPASRVQGPGSSNTNLTRCKSSISRCNSMPGILVIALVNIGSTERLRFPISRAAVARERPGLEHISFEPRLGSTAPMLATEKRLWDVYKHTFNGSYREVKRRHTYPHVQGQRHNSSVCAHWHILLSSSCVCRAGAEPGKWTT